MISGLTLDIICVLFIYYIGIDDEADTNATLLIKCLIRSKRVCSEYKMTQSAFMFVIGEIHSRFEGSIINPGCSFGPRLIN